MSGKLRGFLGELDYLRPAILPVDLAAGATDGDWVKFGLDEVVVPIVYKAAGTASQDPVVTIQQASTNTGTGAKVLAGIDRVLKLALADVFTQAKYEEETQTIAATYTIPGELGGMWAFPIDPGLRDHENGFDFMRIQLSDPGAAAVLGCAFYGFGGSHYRDPIGQEPSRIA